MVGVILGEPKERGDEMTKFLRMAESVMAIVGCVFCIMVAVTMLTGPIFRKRIATKSIVELSSMKEMCARIGYARQETKDNGKLAWEQFILTNSCCVTGKIVRDGEFYTATMIMNPDPNVWDWESASAFDTRVRAYFVLLEKDGLQVWKDCVGKELPLRQIPNRKWNVDMRRRLFELFDEVYGGDLP